ncbi:MAG TPA: pyridoxamine 5'-phosphate oxidase [Sunxiuqinia sp.]|nr:pyridoxamine 5'-phosphate oxidase [Sunxiuqinia sp.]
MLRDIRNNYQKNKLEENQLTTKPILLFKAWLDEAIKLKVNEPTAMVISTSMDNQPDSRVVLLKEIKEDGFIFYTNYGSNKGTQIAKNKRVALNFFWPELERQVRVKGTIQKTEESVSVDYFSARPRDRQLGALSSAQSQVVESREKLEADFKQLEQKYEGQEIPKPENWGGYEITPHEIEFWQGRPGRLHDRIRYYKQPDRAWTFKRLSP